MLWISDGISKSPGDVPALAAHPFLRLPCQRTAHVKLAHFLRYSLWCGHYGIFFNAKRWFSGSVRSAFQGQLRMHNFITLLGSFTALLEWVAAILMCNTVTRQAFSSYLFKVSGQWQKPNKMACIELFKQNVVLRTFDQRLFRISRFPLCHTPWKTPQFHLRRKILQPSLWWCVPCNPKLHVLQAPKSSWPHQLPICEAKKSTARLARPQVRSPIIRRSLFTCSLGAFIESRHFLIISSKVDWNTSNMIPRLSTRDLTKTRTVDPKVQTYGEAFCVHDCNVSII